MRKILIFSLLIISLVTAFVVPASASPLLANVIDPYNYSSSVSVDGTNEIVHVSLPVDAIYWRRYHNDKLSYSDTGPIFEYNTQVRYIDNDQIFCHYFGEGNVISTSGIPTGASISGTSRMSFSVKKDGVLYNGQSYDSVITSYCYLYDSEGVLQKQLVLGSKSTSDLNGFSVIIDWSIPTDELLSFSYFAVFMFIDLSGIADEDDTTTVAIDARGNLINFDIPFNQLAQLKEQGQRTNKLLSDIDQALQDNGQKLDDVIAGNEQIHDDINNAVNGTLPPADVPQGNDKIDDLDNQEGQLRDDAADGLQQGLDMMDDTLDALFTYSFGFFALGMVFELFFQIPFFHVLVSLSLVLGILASFLGIIVSISSAGGGRYSKAKSHHQRSPKSNQPKQGGKA